MIFLERIPLMMNVKTTSTLKVNVYNMTSADSKTKNELTPHHGADSEPGMKFTIKQS